MRRACTVDWKASVLYREAKAHYGINLRTKRALPMLSQWYGISTDEALWELSAVLPNTDPNPEFREALQRLDRPAMGRGY